MEKGPCFRGAEGTGALGSHCFGMLSAEEYLLKADNYAFAALTATPERQLAYIRAAAMCRNKALRLRLGGRAGVLRRCPFTKEELGLF